MFLDSVFIEKEDNDLFSLEKINKNTKKSVLFSRGRRTESFFTEDSKLYITPNQQRMIERGVNFNADNVFDGISARIVQNYRNVRPKESDFLYKKLLEKCEEIKYGFTDLPQNFMRRMSLLKFYNVSVACAIILGMISMTFIYRYLGVGASAQGDTNKVVTNAPVERVLGDEDIKDIKTDKDIEEYIQQVVAQSEKVKKDEFEEELKNMVKGYPIEKMVPYIAKRDRIVAAFLIGIARKESSWGVHVPVYQGKDCFNDWGYRGPNRVGTGGHSCFASPEEAVKIVGDRIEFLVKEKKLDTPAKLSIWKCGSACNKDGQVGKWISDVESIFKKIKD